MYCPNCAAQLDGNRPFCTRCGSPTGAAPPPPATALPVADMGRPASIRLAVILFLISLLTTPISLGVTFMRYQNSSYSLPPTFYIRPIGMLVLWLICVALVWSRQGWARFGLLALIVWGFGNLAYYFAMASARSTFSAMSVGVPLVALVVRLIAIYLSFKSESNAWFKSATLTNRA
jgi:hypothetical protein